MSDASSDGDDWLVEPDAPELQRGRGSRVADAGRPDRLAWNAFRTLALWNTDVWVPAFLETACGPVNPLSTRNWADARIDLWEWDIDDATTVDVTLDGRECIVLVEAALHPDLGSEQLARSCAAVIGRAFEEGRQGGYVVLTPDVAGDAAPLGDLLTDRRLNQVIGERDDIDHEAVARAIGWCTWRDVGELLIDLAEESDALRADQAHRLVSELQSVFPAIGL